MNRMIFRFGDFESAVLIQEKIPSSSDLLTGGFSRALIVCDSNTLYIAKKIAAENIPLVVLPPGEESKTWASVETVLRAAAERGLGRDGLFVGCGGGVVTDITAFAASIYMRGAALCLVSTTLLGMVDAALGGKTGFDLFGLKNLAGTFYPASFVYAPLESLSTLPEREWKSGMAELIKTALLDETGDLFEKVAGTFSGAERVTDTLIAGAVEINGRIVEEDPRETGRRALLNLGHSFGHALEAAAGLGAVSHGEAVAWGMAKAAELGLAKGITPPEKAAAILKLLGGRSYEIRSPHPLIKESGVFFAALAGDKKRRAGKSIFIVPSERGAELLTLDIDQGKEKKLIEHIVSG
jgi:3-dehydroquinate synthase